MPKYQNQDIAELAHQLTLSPVRLRLKQLRGVERMLQFVEPDVMYPYDLACFHITEYRPAKPTKRPLIRGDLLVEDLVTLAEHISRAAGIPITAIRERSELQEQVASRLSVSTNTISRWRKRGLCGIRVVCADGVSRVIFPDSSVRRFVTRNRDLVRRAAAFKQLSEVERDAIITRAGELVGERSRKLHEVARIVAEETGRAIETVRYTLRRYDRENPEAAVFANNGTPNVPEKHLAIFKCYASGDTVREIAKHFGTSQRSVEQIVLEMEARALLKNPVEYIFSPEFEAPDAEALILEIPEPSPDPQSKKSVRVPKDLPAYLQSLYHVPLFNREQERDLFRRYNYIKHKAEHLRDGLDLCRITRKQLEEFKSLLDEAEEYKNRIIQANLRLVVSIAKRHVGSSDRFFEVISDGNMSLMRAIEKFDYTRGHKFSTYSSWAIMKNFARSIPEQYYRNTRYVTGTEELLDVAPAAAETATLASDVEATRDALRAGLSQLSERERAVVNHHFGLGGKHAPKTLEEIGRAFGVTKERIRQIERRALTKLREILSPDLADMISD